MAAVAQIDQPIEARPEPPRRAPLPRAAFVLAGAWYAIFISRTSFTVRGHRTFALFDDAMISMTYARNLAHGHGLVWNAGGPHVEGITNLFWTLVMAVPQALGLGDRWSPLAIEIVGVAVLMGCAIVAKRVVELAAPDRPVAARIAPWWVLFCYPLVYWTLRGMEVGFLTLLLLAGIASCLDAAARGATRRQLVVLAAVCALGSLTRLDFLVFVAVFALWCGRVTRGSTRVALLRVIGASTACSVVGQELFRRAYYGAWVPNTYALKVGGVPLATRAGRGTRAVVYTLLVGAATAGVLAVVAWCARRSSRDRRALGLPLALAAAAAGYCVVVGGDAWEWMRYADRYVAPGVVLLGCVATIGAAELVEGRPLAVRHRRWFAAAAIVATALLLGRMLPGGRALFGVGTVTGIDSRFLACGAAALALVLLAAHDRASVIGRRFRPSYAAFVVVLAFATWAPPVVRWIEANGVHVQDDASDARMGDELGAVTTPSARIAVVAAGNEIFFAHRAGVDLLGKSDVRVAHTPPHRSLPFWPGHTKWDYRFSIAGERPDVVAALWQATPEDRVMIRDAGYQLVQLRRATAARLHIAYEHQQPFLALGGRDAVDWAALEPVTRG